MSFANINDPAGIQALLESLRSSQAWTDAINTAPATNTNASTPAALSANLNPPVTPLPPPVSVQAQPSTSQEIETSGQQFSSEQPSIAALLSQLQSSSALSHLSSTTPIVPASLPDIQPQRAYGLQASFSVSKATKAPPDFSAEQYPHRQKDPRAFTFQQALPHLSSLADDSSFVETIQAMKKEQDNLERKLWEERQEILQKHEEKVKSAKTKAQIIGADLSKHDADMLVDSVRRELKLFDLERVIPAWDGLVSKQQTAFEVLGVPTMCPTSDATVLEKQKRIMQVLEGITGKDP
ncbi:hypothetical protein OF83DRAFT_1287720 [Amylostereum chailletii]|nr:hypothetical protein OF83DRAFT_1287720 [Amylostereum chailletii]